MKEQTPTAIAVAVVRQGECVLIGPRPEGVPLAGYWEFPGGKIHLEESPEDAAVRECLEETGLQVQASRTSAVVEHHYEHGTLRLHFVDADPIESESSPRAPFCWVPIADLDEYQFPPANATVLETLKTDVT